MKTKPMDLGPARAGALRPACPVAVLAAMVIAPASFSQAQHSGSARGTVLRSEFASKLGDTGLDWPTDEAIRAAQARSVEYARYDTSRWQSIVLAAPFRAIGYGGRSVREEGAEFTAAVGADGYDSVYYRWETDDYWLQLRCTRWLISVMAEPKDASPRRELSRQEVEDRTRRAVAEMVRRGPQLLANSSMQIEPTGYGYLIRFQQTAAQSEALWRDMSDRFLGPSEEPAADVGNDWLTSLNVRTDGYSFVFDFVKLGIGPAGPSMPVTATQPGEKTWFKEREPTPAASP